jgi:hypothetical protein
VGGSWRRLRDEELHNFYTSPNVIRTIKLRKISRVGRVARIGEVRNAYNILAGKPEGKRTRGRSKRRWEDNIRMGLGEIRWGKYELYNLSQCGNRVWAVVNTVMSLRFP